MSLSRYPQAYSLPERWAGTYGACSFLGGPVIWEELDGGRGRGSLGRGARSRLRPPHMSRHLKTPVSSIYPPFTSRSSDPKVGKLRQGWTDLILGLGAHRVRREAETRVPLRRGEAGSNSETFPAWRIVAGACTLKGSRRPGTLTSLRPEGGVSRLELGVGPGCGFLKPHLIPMNRVLNSEPPSSYLFWVPWAQICHKS